MKKLRRWINCKLLKSHDWTCAAKEGIKPTNTEPTLEAFKEYAKMYCKSCGYVSELNNW